MESTAQLSIIKGPTRQVVPNSIQKIFQNVALGPAKNNTAIILEKNDEIKKYSYERLDKLTNQIARSINEIIKRKTLKPNSDGDYLIAVNFHPSDELVLVLLSILKAGAAYLPLDYSFPATRIEHILQESRPALVIYDEDTKDFFNTASISFEELLKSSTTEAASTLSESERLPRQKDDLAIVMYTSGSTGIPKGVRIPNKVILNRLQWQFKTFPYSTSENVCVFKTALSFGDSIAEIWGPLMNGLSLLIVPKNVTKDPERLIECLDKYRVERLVLVPSLLRSILVYLELKKDKNVLKYVRLWVCSGETLTASLAEEFFKYFPDGGYRLCNFYGSTEVMADVTFHIISGSNQLSNQNAVPIGIPVDNTIIYLLDNELRPVKAGVPGELFVSGMNLAAGYVNGRDKDKFLDNHLETDPVYSKLYHTGDFARLEKGVLLYEGRMDLQVKIRGHRVDLSEVEKAVLSVEGVEKAVVLCHKPGEMNQTLLAFVKSTVLKNTNHFEQLLKGKLISYMVPQVVLVENIPLLDNGKIDRQALLKNYETCNDVNSCQLDIDYSGVPPGQMKASKILFETVASVLNKSARSAISVDANFYEIGGNSLNSIYTITQLNKNGFYISIRDFLFAINFGEILERSTSSLNAIQKCPPAFTMEMLKNEHKDAAIDLITTGFYKKPALGQWHMPCICEADYVEANNTSWGPLLENSLSFVAKSESGKIVGVTFNCDGRDKPKVQITSKVSVMSGFIKSIEEPVRNSQLLPKGKGEILHSCVMATHSCLSAKENVAIMQFMEDENLKLAKARGFQGIYAININPLTQQLSTDVYHYQTLVDYQVNLYVAPDGSKPFEKAPDSQRLMVHWKSIVN